MFLVVGILSCLLRSQKLRLIRHFGSLLPLQRLEEVQEVALEEVLAVEVLPLEEITVQMEIILQATMMEAVALQLLQEVLLQVAYQQKLKKLIL